MNDNISSCRRMFGDWCLRLGVGYSPLPSLRVHSNDHASQKAFGEKCLRTSFSCWRCFHQNEEAESKKNGRAIMCAQNAAQRFFASFLSLSIPLFSHFAIVSIAKDMPHRLVYIYNGHKWNSSKCILKISGFWMKKTSFTNRFSDSKWRWNWIYVISVLLVSIFSLNELSHGNPVQFRYCT